MKTKRYYNGKAIKSIDGPDYYGFSVKYLITFEDGSTMWVYHHIN